MRREARRVTVVGAGPNGLSAGIAMASAGFEVVVLERAEVAGGGVRTEELTLPGFRHDVCSAVHPLAAASPFFRRLALDRVGLEFVHAPVPLAHPLDGGRAAFLHRSLAATARGLGRDGAAWASLLGPFARRLPDLLEDVLAPPARVPRHPGLLLRFGTFASWPARRLAESRFATEPARALFAGMAAHSFLPLEAPPSAAFGLMLAASGHAVGWPFPRGGAAEIGRALAARLAAAGGTVRTGVDVRVPADLPDEGPVLLDVGPPALLRIAGDRLPAGYRRALARYRYGPAACKVDYALDASIPWAASGVDRAGTVHLGGTLPEIAAAEAAANRGEVPARPFVLVAQPTLFDPTRAPPGRHVAWAYAHVPNGCAEDVADRIDAQIERFAPGFRDRILARTVRSPAELERHDPNLVGGDVNGGIADLRQALLRPAPRIDPYATPDPALFLCSASTPPGGGVHGMCGFHAAASALRKWRNSKRLIRGTGGSDV